MEFKKPDGWDHFTPHDKYAWRKMNPTNATGYVGVSLKKDGKHSASITPPNEKARHLGTFETAKEAGAAYGAAFLEIYGEPFIPVESKYPFNLSPEFIAELEKEFLPMLRKLLNSQPSED